jgi:WD40 repeat protein
LLILRGHTDDVLSVAWSPDGKRLATGSVDKTAKVWDAASGEQVLTLRGHGGRVESVLWSPDGKRLATASWDETARVWDAASGQQVVTLRGHHGWLWCAAWSPGGKRLATAGDDGTVQTVYAMNIYDLMAFARERVTAQPSAESCEKYLHQRKCPQFPEFP